MRSKTSIKKMEKHEEGIVLEFIQRHYKNVYGTIPAACPSFCFIASNQDEVLGVLALEFVLEGKFEIENIYAIDFSIYRHPREKTVYFGKWIAQRKDIGKALAKAAISYSLNLGKLQAVACSKPRIIQYLRTKYKFKFDVFDVPIFEQSVPCADSLFFLEKPKPHLYVGLLEQWHNAIEI